VEQFREAEWTKQYDAMELMGVVIENIKEAKRMWKRGSFGYAANGLKIAKDGIEALIIRTYKGG